MDVFGTYAQFYDILYQDKDYAAECDFLETVFSRYASAPICHILDLGCGTGGHALLLAQRGYSVTGVDLSEKMLSVARAKASAMELANVPSFQQGDMRNLDLGMTFDAVLSMFAVVSYMVNNVDLQAALRSARRHLNSGGLFVFDAWFGPAVLTERPTNRFKIVEVGGERIIRFTHSKLDLLQHTVNVHYKVLRLQGKCIVDEVDEVHPIRFLFPQEVTHYLDETGFQVKKLCPFLRPDDDLDERDWNISVVAEAT